MAYESIDKLQKVLADEIFSHTKDPKKAAGRALGTFIEIITYYLLKTWGFNHQTSIERGLEEYGNPAITHNVEFSLHPVIREHILKIDKSSRTITANVIKKALEKEQVFDISGYKNKFVSGLLSKEGVLRNAYTMTKSDNLYLLCSIKENKHDNDQIELHIYEQMPKAYAIFECKRVGVEEGMSKGPQTIEKAKQGAYVARTASSLQKIRNESGELYGIIYKSDNTPLIKPYIELMEDVVYSNEPELLRRFILTVGVVSNHGNWIKKNKEGAFDFSDENFQKELMVLAQSYDWLLFLTDEGLSKFIESLLLNPSEEFEPVKQAFLSSYTQDKKKNQFTKVQMNLDADRILLDFFSKNITAIEGWFKVISPKGKELVTLKDELSELNKKNWKEILV
ncbi:MAG: hypothetical protein HYR66_11120 [Sphingobacteriales bacterium]|nr:hypothetical protein [Sphingobacteriales bacterium]MBI3718284.1 hypothetical protein [Sphingobacteriales bacterium]